MYGNSQSICRRPGCVYRLAIGSIGTFWTLHFHFHAQVPHAIQLAASAVPRHGRPTPIKRRQPSNASWFLRRLVIIFHWLGRAIRGSCVIIGQTVNSVLRKRPVQNMTGYTSRWVLGIFAAECACLHHSSNKNHPPEARRRGSTRGSGWAHRSVVTAQNRAMKSRWSPHVAA